MNPFLTAPEFIERDNRIRRTFSPISAEQMYRKHQALLPRSIVSGKTILDIGCGIGATGHWCLSAGARYYTGIEPQHEYAETATQLLSVRYADRARIIESSLETYLNIQNEQFDIVAVLAVLHASVDVYARLHAVAARARSIVAIEELMPRRMSLDPAFVGIEFSEAEGMNLADRDASLSGRGARISPAGLEFVMRGFGFESSGVLTVSPISDTTDNFNAPATAGNARYLMRFTRTGAPMPSVSEQILAHDHSRVRIW